MRERWTRLALAVVLGFLALLQIHGLVRTLSSEKAFREQALRQAREVVLALRGPVSVALRPGGVLAFRDAARSLPPGMELMVFDPQGRPLYSELADPAPDLRHWPTAMELEDLVKGGALTAGPLPGKDPRMVTYMSMLAAGSPIVVRVATPADAFVAEQKERRFWALACGVGLGLLVVAGLLLLRPPSASVEGGPTALRAYEEAMGRLQEQGERVSQRHDEERQRLHAELLDKEAMARAGELTSGIVHEVRNGLGTIAGYARMIEGGAAPPGALSAAREIRQECATLETVVRRFVDFVKHETLHVAPLDLVRMLRRVAAREGRAYPSVEILLPAPGTEATVAGDEEMLERAFENLIRNACAATGEGRRVWLEVAREGESISVHIGDEGPGLPPERRKTIRPFATSKGGLGLGLPTAQKIVRLHGGELTLDEREPCGLRVTVRLPMAPSGGEGRA